MNWSVIILTVLVAIGIIILTFVKNMKDEEEFEEHAHQDYPKPHHDITDTDAEETPK